MSSITDKPVPQSTDWTIGGPAPALAPEASPINDDTADYVDAATAVAWLGRALIVLGLFGLVCLAWSVMGEFVR